MLFYPCIFEKTIFATLGRHYRSDNRSPGYSICIIENHKKTIKKIITL
jgi:hypothetical protein